MRARGHRRAHRVLGHDLDAGGDRDVVGAGDDALGGEVGRLLRRAALAVDGGGGDRLGPAGAEHGVAPDVQALVPDLKTQPMITSSTRAGSRLLRSTRASEDLGREVGEQGLNIGRNAVLTAGWPESVPATTVDRPVRRSSQQALHFAAQGVMAGQYDVVIAAGAEVMTQVPDGLVGDRRGSASRSPGDEGAATPPPGLAPQGIGADMIADEYGLDPRGPRRASAPSQPTAGGRRPAPRAASTDGADRGWASTGDRHLGQRAWCTRATRASARARPLSRSPA